MKKVAAYLLFSLITGIISCEEELSTTAPDYYHIVTGNTKKTWKITKLEWSKGGVPDGALTDLEVCDRDNLYTFYANADRLFEVNYGTNTCSAGEDAILSDQWSLVNATATLTMPLPIYTFGTTSALPFFMEKVTKKEMTLSIYLDQDNLYSYTITMQSVSEE